MFKKNVKIIYIY